MDNHDGYYPVWVVFGNEADNCDPLWDRIVGIFPAYRREFAEDLARRVNGEVIPGAQPAVNCDPRAVVSTYPQEEPTNADPG